MFVADFQALCAGGQGCADQGLITRVNLRAIDPDPAVGALELDAVALALFVHDGPVNTVVVRRAHGVDHAIGVGIMDYVVAEGVVAAGNRLRQHFALHADRTGLVNGPARDVIVVRAPVGHGSAGVFVPPAEVGMAALFDVIDLGRLAEPEIPVQPRRHLRRGKRAGAQSSRQPDRDLLELPDAPVAHQFAGQAKFFAAALLRAGLEDDPALANGLDHVFALVNSQGQRLFSIDILARLGGGEVDQCVPMVRRGVDDDVNVVALQDLSKIMILLRRAGLFAVLCGRGRGVGVIDVADGDQVAKAHGIGAIVAALAATADERHDGPVIRPQPFWAGGGLGQVPLDEPSRQAGGGGGQGAGFKEGTAADEKRV